MYILTQLTLCVFIEGNGIFTTGVKKLEILVILIGDNFTIDAMLIFVTSKSYFFSYFINRGTQVIPLIPKLWLIGFQNTVPQTTCH